MLFSKSNPTKRALDGWDSALEVLSTPAHPQVTQTVGWLRAKSFQEESNRNSSHINVISCLTT